MIADFFTIAAYQGPAIYGDQNAALRKILDVLQYAKNVDVLLFPEVFLHGYFYNEQDARQHAIDIQSAEFKELLAQFVGFSTMVIVGINELSNNGIYNTAILIENGQLIGTVRKATTYPPYDYYSVESKSSVFYKKNIGFGVCICCDINYFRYAHLLCKEGAQIIFCPMWNVIEKNHSLLPHIHNKAHFITMAQQNHAWFVGSDVTLVSDKEIGMGCGCIIDPLGNIVATGQVLTENIITYHISNSTLDPKRRLLDREIQHEKIATYCKI